MRKAYAEMTDARTARGTPEGETSDRHSVARDAAADGSVAAIDLVGVAKEFSARRGSVAAVREVDLEIRRGEFFSLLGPSGCGKTTTLRMIAGFEEPSRGRVLLYGQDVTGVPPYRRDVNMVFQSYALFPHMTVQDNVAFGLRRKGVGKAESARRAGEMLELVELTGKGELQAARAVGRPAAAGSAGPRAGQPPAGAAAGRAAGRAGPQAPPGDADRAEADPA